MAETPKISEELAKQDQAYEPLLPIEKKLITWSFILGVGGLALLVWISYTYFPGGH
jgi:predicted acyltransferase